MPVPLVFLFGNHKQQNNMLTTKEVNEINQQVAHIRAAAAEQLSNLDGNLRSSEVLAALINAHTQLTASRVNANTAIAVVDHTLKRTQELTQEIESRN